MTTKFLSRVIAGAALGGMAMLIAPGIAAADPHSDRDHDKDKGWIYTDPKVVEAGERAFIVQICKDAQQDPVAWSKVTGKVELRPSSDKWDHDDKKFDRDDQHDKKFDRDDHDDKKFKHHDKKFDRDDHDDKKFKHHDKKFDRDDHDDKKFKHHDKKFDKDDDHPFAYFAKVHIPKDTKPGKYELKGSCADGEIIVKPHGHINGGDGGAVGTGGMLAGGAGALAAAALGGTFLLRKRSADGTLA